MSLNYLQYVSEVKPTYPRNALPEDKIQADRARRGSFQGLETHLQARLFREAYQQLKSKLQGEFAKDLPELWDLFGISGASSVGCLRPCALPAPRSIHLASGNQLPEISELAVLTFL